MKNKQINPFKFFEVAMIWLLTLCLVLKGLLFFKLINLAYKIKGQITNQTDFLTMINMLSDKQADLKGFYSLGLMYRTFLFCILLIFALLVIYRVIKNQSSKLLQMATIMIWFSFIHIVYYTYITKDVFYALRILIDKRYYDFQGIMYLLGRLQYILDMKYILLAITIIILITTSLAIILNIYALRNKDSYVKCKKLNISILTISFLSIFSLMAWQYKIYLNTKIFNPLSSMVLNYKNKADNIYLVGSVNMRKVNRHTIDIALRNLYLNGVNYEIENSKKPLEKGEKREIKVSYDLELVNHLGLRPAKMNKKVIIKQVPELVKSIEEINIMTLYKYLSKYDARYSIIKENQFDDISGIYMYKEVNGEHKYYLLQKVTINDLSISQVKNIEPNKDIYKLIYLGNLYRLNGEVVGVESLNNYEAVSIYQDTKELLDILKEEKIIKVK